MVKVSHLKQNWLEALSLTATLVLLSAIGWIITDIFTQGISGLKLEFLTQEPVFSGRQGGILPILVSTLLIVGIALCISLPISVFAALFLYFKAEKGSFLAHSINKLIDVLASTPSIVFGLFGNAFFVIVLDLGFSLLTGGLTLACMIVPTIIRAIQIGLFSLSKDLRRAVEAMGLSDRSVFVKVIFPLIIPSLIMGTILGLARSLAETAALLFTSGYVDRMPESILDSGRALSVHIYELAMNIPGGNTNAYASALVLIVLLFIINSAAIGVSHLWIKSRSL